MHAHSKICSEAGSKLAVWPCHVDIVGVLDWSAGCLEPAACTSTGHGDDSGLPVQHPHT
jgi:hypothetical protein